MDGRSTVVARVPGDEDPAPPRLDVLHQTGRLPAYRQALASVLAAVELPQPAPSGTGPNFTDPDAPRDLEDAFELIQETVTDLWSGFIGRLPLIVLAVVILLAGLLAGRYAALSARRGLRRTRTNAMVTALLVRMVRALTVTIFLLLALSVAGINIGAVLALLGLAGVAVALALQPILENFMAGVLLLIRKPFVAGDQIIVGKLKSEEIEGTVEEIDFRVTQLVDYDGETILVPNAEVLSSAIVNLTGRGRRRSSVAFSVDYRDDHNAVGDLVRTAVVAVEGVMEDPEPRVLCRALGESGVEFEVMFWSLPQQASVNRVSDKVVRMIKDTVEEAGMTIPWPIRTVSFDNEPAGPPDAGRVG